MNEKASSADRLPPGIWKVISVAAVGSFLAQLDATVVNVSLSSLAADLHTTLQVIQWVTSGYLLALALALPLNGWLVERIGAKRLYIICFTGFTVCSTLCALSWSASSLIGFRILQGISGGLLAPMAQLIVARSAGKFFVKVAGYAAVPILLGPILGPVVAGAILQYGSWHWLFLVNLPVGIFAIALALLFLPHDELADKKGKPLDLAGLFLLSPSLALFLYGADHLQTYFGWASLLSAAILFVLFLRKAAKDGPRALIDLRLFKSPVFSAAAITQFSSNGLMFAAQMLIPVYLIQSAGESTSTTGWLMAPLGFGMMCMYPWAGRITEHLGIRGTATTGAAIALLGTLPLLYLSSHHLNFAVLAIALFVRGAGMSTVSIPSVSAAYATVPRSELPMATTSINIVQRIGGPTLTTLCATFLGWRMAAVPSHSGVEHAMTESFLLLCILQALLLLVTFRLPASLDRIRMSEDKLASSHAQP